MITSLMVVLQALVLLLALYWTLGLINKIMEFICRVMRNQDAEVKAYWCFRVSFCWAVFFLLMRIA